MTETKNIPEFMKELKAYIDNTCNCIDTSDTYRCIDFEAYLGDEDIAEALSKGIDNYYDLISDTEFDYMLNYFSEFIGDYSKYSNFGALYDIASDYISDHIIFNSDIGSTPLETFTLLDMGDANYDYDVPSCYFSSEDLRPNFDTDDQFKCSAITWLIRSQGYDPVQFVKDLHSENGYKGDSKFLKSLASELNDCYTSNSYAVCIPSLITADEYCTITKQQEDEVALYDKFKPLSYIGSSYLVFDKGTKLGLFDPLHSSGSNFDIVLEKDIKIPLPCADIFLDYGTRSKWAYTVSSVYVGSMSDDCHGLSHYQLMSQSDIKFTLNR